MLFAAVDIQVERVKCRVFSMRKLIIWLLNCVLVWLLKGVNTKQCNNNFFHQENLDETLKVRGSVCPGPGSKICPAREAVQTVPLWIL